jgi:hypothetical protein
MIPKLRRHPDRSDPAFSFAPHLGAPGHAAEGSWQALHLTQIAVTKPPNNPPANPVIHSVSTAIPGCALGFLFTKNFALVSSLPPTDPSFRTESAK